MKKIFTFYASHFYSNFRSTIFNDENTSKQGDCELYSVPDSCVENIMLFARAYDTVESDSVGTVEMIMN